MRPRRLILIRALARMASPARRAPVRWTRSRAMAMFVWLPLCAGLGVFHWICLLLDEVLFPGYRKVRVEAPVFIVGCPRGGTTFLHRVLAKDTGRFTCYLFGEMVFTPSILQRKAVALLARADAALGGRVAAWMRRFEKPFFDPYAHMHRVSVFAPEEDFVMNGYVLANQLFLTVFPYPDLFGDLWRFDREVPPARRARVTRFYRRCLQRHLYFHGAHKTHLSKNPFFTSMIGSLLEEFPDSRFILNVRDPRENVPSFLSVWEALYAGIGNAPDHPLAQEFILDWLRETYLYGADRVEALPPERGIRVPYEALVADPRAAARRIYAAFGFEITPAFEAVLEEENARARGYTSAHRYTAAAYGLDTAAIEARFADVIARFGFPPPGAADGAAPRPPEADA